MKDGNISYDPPKSAGLATSILATIEFSGDPAKIATFKANNPDLFTHLFYVNGDYLFDLSSAVGTNEILGSKTITASVDWIDMTPPECDIIYSTTDYTNLDVTASIGTCTKPVVASGSDYYIFSGNGNYTFYFADYNGMTGSATAIVNRIDKSPVV